MQQGICNPEFYGDLVYKFKKIVGNPNFSDLFKRIVNRFKIAGYTSWTSSNLVRIRPRTAELAALEHLKNLP